MMEMFRWIIRFIALQSVRNSKKSLGSYKKAAKLFSYYTSGIADYRKVISGGDATEGENIRK